MDGMQRFGTSKRIIWRNAARLVVGTALALCMFVMLVWAWLREASSTKTEPATSWLDQ
jgi:hypothetical protein